MPVMKVEGMHCQNCVKAVTEAVRALPGAKGVEVSLEKGEVKWDKQPESELDLGKAYYYGQGTKKNFKKARKHLQKAADAGFGLKHLMP